MGKENEQETVEVALEDMEKSFNDAKSTVLELLGEPKTEDLEKSDEEDKDQEDASKEDLEKAKKKKEDMEYEEEEEDEDEEDEDAKKSLSDSIEEDAEAEAAMDVEPFLNQLVKGIEEQFALISTSIAKVSKEVAGVRDLQKATAKMVMASQELQKAMAETVEVIGNTPIKSSSIVRKIGGKLEKSESGVGIEMSNEEILLKASKLRADGKLTLRDVTKIEGRLNKGLALDENLIKILKEDK